MNRRMFSFTLAACTMWAGACLVFGDEKSTAVPVVYLGRSSLSALPVSKDELRGRLLQELARQSFLVAARDQLGLRTRDVSLGDEMPGGGDDAPFEVARGVRESFPPGRPTGVRVPSARRCGTRNCGRPRSPRQMARDRSFTSIDYRAVLTEMEELSRGGFVDGRHGRPAFRGSPTR